MLVAPHWSSRTWFSSSEEPPFLRDGAPYGTLVSVFEISTCGSSFWKVSCYKRNNTKVFPSQQWIFKLHNISSKKRDQAWPWMQIIRKAPSLWDVQGSLVLAQCSAWQDINREADYSVSASVPLLNHRYCLFVA